MLDELIERAYFDSDKDCADVVSLLIYYAIRNDKPYNVYRFSNSGYNYFRMKTMLDDFITVIGYELYLDMLDDCGLNITDYPSYDDLVINHFFDVGVQFPEEAYLSLEEIREEITKLVDSTISTHHTTAIFLEFLYKMSGYTDIKSVIAKIYMMIHKNSNIVKVDTKEFLSNYSDVLRSKHMYDDAAMNEIGVDLIYEYISSDVKSIGLFPWTYYEFINNITPEGASLDVDCNTVFKTIYDRLLSGEDITQSIEEPVYVDGKLSYMRKKEKDEEDIEYE